jgi:hypothetical protein
VQTCNHFTQPNESAESQDKNEECDEDKKHNLKVLIAACVESFYTSKDMEL